MFFFILSLFSCQFGGKMQEVIIVRKPPETKNRSGNNRMRREISYCQPHCDGNHLLFFTSLKMFNIFTFSWHSK